jgi:LysR family nitrogen assimilation transcriptional regulator
VTFAEAVARELVMPEPRDSVRTLVAQTARELGLELRLAHEIRSISGIKSLILHGAAMGILPYGTVLAEVRARVLGTRPIVQPTLRRTLYLASAGDRLTSELALIGVLQQALRLLAREMGALGHPLLPSEE